MTWSTIKPVLVCSAALALVVATHADDPDDASDLVLGTTILLHQDGSMVRIPEREALSAPWIGSATGVSIGKEQGCALAWPLAMAPRAISQAVWLADGQCLPGAPDLAEAAQPGTIRWRAGPMLMTLPLSALRAWTAVGVDVPTGTLDADRITLRNGDTVDGLVTDFGSTVTIDVDGATRTFEDELIASVQFVQATDASTTIGRLRVWVDDGAIIDAESIERDGTLLRLNVRSRRATRCSRYGFASIKCWGWRHHPCHVMGSCCEPRIRHRQRRRHHEARGPRCRASSRAWTLPVRAGLVRCRPCFAGQARGPSRSPLMGFW